MMKRRRKKRVGDLRVPQLPIETISVVHVPRGGNNSKGQREEKKRTIPLTWHESAVALYLRGWRLQRGPKLHC
jgi:hypothetical protein